MVRRIATLLGLFGLGALLCLVAALTSGCGLPVTKGGFQQQLSHGLGPVHERLDALDRKVTTFEESTTANFAVANANFQTLASGVEQATKRAEAAKSFGETTIKLLRPIGRDAGIASKEATAGRKATEAASQKVAEAQKALGEKIDSTAATTSVAVADVGHKVDSATADAATAHAVLDQKVDRRADEVVGAVEGVDRKVDVANATLGVVKTTAEKAATEAETAKVEAQMAGVKADAAGTRAEAAAQVAGAKAEAAGNKAEAAAVKAAADTTVEVGKARKEIADHAAEAENARAKIITELNRLITRPLP